MRKVTRNFVMAFVLIALSGLTACERTLSGGEKSAVLAFSEASVDNLLEGWTANDYPVFSRNFDTGMRAEIPAASFAALKQDLGGRLGNYISRRVDQVTRSDEFYVVTYRARFQQEEAVKITVAFHISNRSIVFLGVDSEDVSWSTFQ